MEYIFIKLIKFNKNEGKGNSWKNINFLHLVIKLKPRFFILYRNFDPEINYGESHCTWSI